MEQKNEWRQRLTLLIISFLGGFWGLDRFYKGDVGWGVVKLITAGGLGVWYLVDLAIAAYEFGKIDREIKRTSTSG